MTLDMELDMATWDVRFDLLIDIRSPDLVRLVERADALASVVRGLPVPPGIRLKLDRLNILRAVHGTTGIEGSDLSTEEVGEILTSKNTGPVLSRSRGREEQEVRNAAKVMRFISASLKVEPELELDESMIATIHRMTTDEIEYANNSPGIYRSHAVHVDTYVPPRERETLQELMRLFVEWLHGGASSQLPPTVKAVAAHFYFISIHPFGDGNGRTARAIESFLLYQARVNVLGFYSLSNFYYRYRPEYVELLDRVRFQTDGNLTPFIRFALQGLVSELESVHQEVLHEMTLIAFRDFARERLLERGKLGTLGGERIYQFLIGLQDPVPLAAVRAGKHPLAAIYRGVSDKTFMRDVAFLREERLIVEEDGGVRSNLGLMQDFMP